MVHLRPKSIITRYPEPIYVIDNPTQPNFI